MQSFIFALVGVGITIMITSIVKTAITPKSLKTRYAECTKRTRAVIQSVDERSFGDAMDMRSMNISHPNNEYHIPDVWVRYSFNYNGQEYDGGGTVHYFKAMLASKKKNVKISIFFNPNQPNTSCTANDKNQTGVRSFVHYAIITFGVIAAVIVIPLILMIILT